MNTAPRWLATGILLLPAACAKITAPGMDFAGPTPTLDVRATQEDGLFSHFTGGLTATVSVQHAGPVPPIPSAVPAGPTTGAVTYRLSAVPAFAVEDVVTVTWSAPARTLVGSAYTLTQRARYRILAATLQVQTPAGGLPPGESGAVCVALLPRAPAGANVTLQSSVVAVAPAILRIPAGQAKATAAARATLGGLPCPGNADEAAPAAHPEPCSARNGVVASANFGGVTVQGCATLAPRCCGATARCAPTPAPASICP
ncbi:MAG: hypothetical protein JSR36_08680 [Proteobacteria bacterium]|nr:hypothetical protein [Pseudomonadota bacterium]